MVGGEQIRDGGVGEPVHDRRIRTGEDHGGQYGDGDRADGDHTRIGDRAQLSTRENDAELMAEQPDEQHVQIADSVVREVERVDDRRQGEQCDRRRPRVPIVQCDGHRRRDDRDQIHGEKPQRAGQHIGRLLRLLPRYGAQRPHHRREHRDQRDGGHDQPARPRAEIPAVARALAPPSIDPARIGRPPAMKNNGITWINQLSTHSGFPCSAGSPRMTSSVTVTRTEIQ
nr:hypothetical protein [Nocardia crassostreae]